MIRQALHPYPDGVVIATKGGLTRPVPDVWRPCGRPEYLQQCAELSLRRLGVDCLDLYYPIRIDPQVPLADQLGVQAELRRAGKIRHIGLSKVTLDQVEQARTITDIAAVQNQHRLSTTDPDEPAETLRPLLDRSPAMLGIPGTTSLEHLRANCTADQPPLRPEDEGDRR